MDEQTTIDRAQKAQKLLDDPVLGEAFAAVRHAIFDQIEQTPIRDRDALHEWRLMLKLLRDVRANLDEAIRNGKLVAFRAKERDQESKIRRFVKGLTHA